MRVATCLVLFTVGCGGGVVGTLPSDIPPTYSFNAQAVVSPAVPEPGRRTQVALEVRSASSAPLTVDIEVRVYSGSKLAYEQKWADVPTRPEEVLDVRQDFLPASDAKEKFTTDIRVTSHEDGAALFSSTTRG